MVLQSVSPEGYGPAVDPESLPLSAKTVKALWAWYGRWGTLFLHDDDAMQTPLDKEVDWRLLEEEGVSLWRRVRDELAGRFDVLYYSEIRHSNFNSPEDYNRLLG